MSLRGVDVSGWQPDFTAQTVGCDFVIVKATGGVSYRNPCFVEQCEDALAHGRKLGIYHFAGDGCPGSAANEAANFLKSFERYKGRAIPILDWEADAVNWPTAWAKEWLETVEKATGALPWFYSYSSAVNSHDYGSIARFPLWIAAYYAGYQAMGWQSNPPLYGGTGAWKKPVAYQYTSSGRVGYPGNLDLNIFYGDKKDWDYYVNPKKALEEQMAITNKELENIAFKVWAYKNEKLERKDAYQILRDCRDALVRVEKNQQKMLELLGK